MSNVFFCSDLHLGHLSILSYESIRLQAVWEKYHSKNIDFQKFKQDFDAKFNNKSDNIDYLRELLRQHDTIIINNWNSVVSKHDTVWFLGDFCMGGRSTIKEYMSKLNGYIRMVKGNHDNYPNKVYLDAGVRSVSEHPVILKQKFILSHAPLDVFLSNDAKSCFVNIFGHVHSGTIVETKTDHYQCVCLERQNLRPIRISDIEDYTVPKTNYNDSERHN